MNSLPCPGREHQGRAATPRLTPVGPDDIRTNSDTTAHPSHQHTRQGRQRGRQAMAAEASTRRSDELDTLDPQPSPSGIGGGFPLYLSLIHISEPTRRTPI